MNAFYRRGNMTREEAKEYLTHLLSAHTALIEADANYQYIPFPRSKLAVILRELEEEIRFTRKIAKGKIFTE